MSRRDTFGLTGDRDTQIKILDTATKLFALRTFKSVTLKEIAKAVGIKTASIYYYYEDKEALIEDVLLRFEEIFSEYHRWLAEVNEKAATVDEVIHNLFNHEFLERLSPISRLGMSMTIKEQHNHKYAKECAFKHIYEESIRNIQAGFDNLIERKVIPPSDTKTLATLFMFCVVAGNEVIIYEYADKPEPPPIDCGKVYTGLEKLMKAALSQGILTTEG